MWLAKGAAKINKYVVGVMLVLALGAVTGAQADETPSLLHVTGQATVYAVPDNVRVSVGVLTISSELEAARDENAAIFQKVLDAIAALQYKDMFMKSVGFDVSTITEDKSSHDLSPPKIIGYRVENQLTIRVTNAPPEELSKRAANIIDIAVSNGANTVGSLEIFVKEQEQYKQEALLAAVKNAREKAQAIAKTLDVKIVGYRSVTAQDVGYYSARRDMQMMNVAGVGGGAATTVEAGLVQITANVSLSCEIE